ncbi:unnamed protein product [Ixodes pacificus]
MVHCVSEIPGEAAPAETTGQRPNNEAGFPALSRDRPAHRESLVHLIKLIKWPQKKRKKWQQSSFNGANSVLLAGTTVKQLSRSGTRPKNTGMPPTQTPSLILLILLY